MRKPVRSRALSSTWGGLDPVSVEPKHIPANAQRPCEQDPSSPNRIVATEISRWEDDGGARYSSER